MTLMNTCSQVVGLSQQLEEDSARFYESLVGCSDEVSDVFKSLGAQNKKLASVVRRAYLSSVTDAAEGCFAFRLDSHDYRLHSIGPSDILGSAVARAMEIERTMARFYADAGDQAKALLPDLSRALRMAGKARDARIEAICALAVNDEEGTRP